MIEQSQKGQCEQESEFVSVQVFVLKPEWSDETWQMVRMTNHLVGRGWYIRHRGVSGGGCRSAKTITQC